MSNPTPDLTATRDNQQQPPQWAVEAAKVITTDSIENVAYYGLIAMRAAIIAKCAPQPAPAVAPVGVAVDAAGNTHVPAIWHRAIESADKEISDLRAQLQAVKDACGGFMDKPFDGSLVGAINAISLRCASAEKNLQAATERADALQRELAEWQENLGTESKQSGQPTGNLKESVQAWHKIRRDLTTARAELAKWRDRAGKFADGQRAAALAAYRALAGEHGEGAGK